MLYFTSSARLVSSFRLRRFICRSFPLIHCSGNDFLSDGYDIGEKDNILPIRLSFHRVGGGDSSELYKENDFESSSWSLLFSDTSEWESRKRRAGLKQQNPGHPPRTFGTPLSER